MGKKNETEMIETVEELQGEVCAVLRSARRGECDNFELQQKAALLNYALGNWFEDESFFWGYEDTNESLMRVHRNGIAADQVYEGTKEFDEERRRRFEEEVEVLATEKSLATKRLAKYNFLIPNEWSARRQKGIREAEAERAKKAEQAAN